VSLVCVSLESPVCVSVVVADVALGSVMLPELSLLSDAMVADIPPVAVSVALPVIVALAPDPDDEVSPIVPLAASSGSPGHAHSSNNDSDAGPGRRTIVTR
jgi:hypothetical protein